MAVRPYVFMPYFASIMLVTTTIMIITFTGKTLIVGGTSPSSNMASMITTFTTATIFHSYLIGLVGGKIAEESISAGFKHSTVLVILAVLAAKALPLLVSF